MRRYLLKGEDEGGSEVVAVEVEGREGVEEGGRRGEMEGWGDRGEINLHEGCILGIHSSEEKDVMLVRENHLRASILFLL